ncbi:MAG TPA: hypothetical protein VMP08_20000 [Anaerolineae bacterium]|nr:hypothetical protein [Anaerolineae bacterium]
MTKKKTSRSRSSTRYLTLAIVGIMVLMSICAIWNSSTFDLGWIFLTFGAAVVITAFVIAPLLLPIEDNGDERRGMQRVFNNFLMGSTQPMALVRDGKIVWQSAGFDPNDYPTRGMIVTDSCTVVALRTNTGLSRIEGANIDQEGRSHSGVIFTTYEEGIDTVIDLRPQVRRKPTTAQTRDGITVEVAVVAFFVPRATRARKLKEIDQLKHPQRATTGAKRAAKAIPYPPPFAWRRSSIIQALNTRRIERVGEQTRKTDWYDRIMEIAIPRLRDLISEYTIDQLTAWTTTDYPKHPRYIIRDKLRDTVIQELNADDEVRHSTGIEVRFMAVSAPQPPDEIIQRRIQAWTEEWRKKEADIFAEAEAEAILTRELARAQVQGEMTARINDILQEAQASDTARSDLVMLRFLEAMEKMSKDPTTRALLTFDSLKILQQLRELVAPSDQGGNKAPTGLPERE